MLATLGNVRRSDTTLDREFCASSSSYSLSPFKSPEMKPAGRGYLSARNDSSSSSPKWKANPYLGMILTWG